MAGDPEGIVGFKLDGKSYELVFGNRAIKATETHFDKPFFQAIQQIMPSLEVDDISNREKVEAAATQLRFTDLSCLFEFALLKHHKDVAADEDKLDDLIDSLGWEKVTKLLGDVIASAVSMEAGEDATANPPNRPARRASRVK